MRLSARPSDARVDRPVTFTLVVDERHAPGALHYRLSFGDGATAANVTNDVCVAGPGLVAHRSWTLVHLYRAAGSHTVVASVGVNCSPDRARVVVTVRSHR